MTNDDLRQALAAAVDALGKIMHSLNSRQLGLDAPMPSPLHDSLVAADMGDAKMLDLAADAFEAGGLALAAAGHPGVTHIECDGGLGSEEYRQYAATLDD